METIKQAAKAALARRSGGLARALSRRAQGGVTTIEYALLAGLLGLALVVCLGELKEALAGVFKGIAEALNAIPK